MGCLARQVRAASDSGMQPKLRKLNPGKTFIKAQTAGNGATCKSCAHCPWMAMAGLGNPAHALRPVPARCMWILKWMRAPRSINHTLAFTGALENGSRKVW